MSATSSRPRVFSGIQPTSDSFHLGNYLGAIRYWVGLQRDYDAFYCVVDLHAITVPHDPQLLRRRTRVAAAQLLAVGLEPELCTLFVQSHVPQHSQLTWVLQCLAGYGEASRMTQFKDKSARDELGGASVGLFTYPMLMAADILLYQADAVPVGEDQRQHLELTRDLAGRFNTRFGQTFVVPEPHIVRETAKITDLQDPVKKMSKSAASQAGVLDLLDEPRSLEKKIRSAVTDTGREVVTADDKPGITNLLTIVSTLTGESVSSCEQRFAGSGYGDFKKAVGAAVVDALTPIRERTQAWLADEAALDAVLAAGAWRARVVAGATLEQVYDRIGFLPST